MQAGNDLTTKTFTMYLQSNLAFPTSGYGVFNQSNSKIEFVLFGKDNSIVRVDKKGNWVVCNTNWRYQGGEVFGTFTYNVADELIIAISERNSTTDCPLKIINLDRDEKIDNADDNIYTLTPNIPKSNIVDVEYIIGNKIKKGKYNFFIKYFINDNYETAWFPIGIPVFAYDNNDSDTKKTILNHRIQATDLNLPPDAIERYFVSYTDFYNDDNEYTDNNIKLIFEIENTVYTHFRIGYIINRQSSTEGRMLPKHNIKDTTVIVNNISEPISVDELTINNFNLFNVNTLCNYKNRLYLANYKEENRNSIIDKIDTSGIKVFYDYYESNIPEITSPEGDIKKLDFSQLKNQWKPKPGRAAIYNFFIHYVYPNGNYTDGPYTSVEGASTAAKDLSAYGLRDGWTGARTGCDNAGTAILVGGRVDCVILGATRAYGRLDSPQLVGLKPDASANVSVSFDYSGSRSGSSTYYPVAVCGSTGFDGLLNGYATQFNNAESWTDIEGKQSVPGIPTNGSATSLSKSMTYTITDCTSTTRLSWHVAGMGYKNFKIDNGNQWMYIDNIKVQITK